MEKIIQIITPYATPDASSDVYWGELIALTDMGRIFKREYGAKLEWKEIKLPERDEDGMFFDD